MLASSLTNLASASSGAGSAVLFLFVILLVVAVILIAAMWKTFQKAGKPGWAAIIPIYNGWVLFEIAGQPGWYVLLGLIPFVGWAILLVLEIIAVLEIAKRFGKSGVFGFFLLFLIPIGWLILGFGDAQYNASAGGGAATPATNPPAPAGPAPIQPAASEPDKSDQQPPTVPSV